jgi:hypothetical protein
MLKIALTSIQLILPALIPSWRFFDAIAPSPRIEFALIGVDEHVWHEFRPKPQKVNFLTMLKQMVWNPSVNEGLFLVSCAERIIKGQTPEHSEAEIVSCLTRDLNKSDVQSQEVQFRLIFISRKEDVLQKHVLYQSKTCVLTKAQI